MIIFPAIDLKDGQCVRLLRGAMDKATLYNQDPAAQAAIFAAAGADHLHVVDLDGAMQGQSVNGEAIQSIRAATPAFLQLGGGVRSLEAIDFWLEAGVDRVVLGTLALQDPDFVSRATETFPGQVAVGVDARSGFVAVAGWTQTSTMLAADFASDMAERGIAAIIYTDIERDGALEGVNLLATASLASSVCVPVIASGGVAGIEDILSLREAGNIAGVICGKALYDKRLDLAEALQEASQDASQEISDIEESPGAPLSIQEKA